MKRFVLGLIVGVVACFLGLCVHWVVQTVSYYSASNAVGANSSRSPDGRWSIWVSDEYDHDVRKNYLTFGIYTTNGNEVAYTRLEHHGGTARSSKILWNDDGDVVTVSAHLNPGGGPLGEVEIQYDFAENQFTTRRIPNNPLHGTR